MFTTRARLGFVAAAVALAAYPLLRPWGAESGIKGMSTFATTRWPISHAFGMLGFVCLALALRAGAAHDHAGRGDQSMRRAESWAWIAVSGLLPYYGAEAFGLHAVGTFAAAHNAPEILVVADEFRYGTIPLACFAIGLIALAGVGARLIHGSWARGGTTRLGGLLAGAGLLTYLPQFFTPGPVRIAHGLVLATGLVLLALRPRPA